MFKFIKSQIKISQQKKAEEQKKIENQRRIQEEKYLREVKQRKIEEEKKTENEIYSLIKDNISNVCELCTNMLAEEKSIIEAINKSNIFYHNKKEKSIVSEDIIINKIIEVYKLVKDVDTINDFDSILNKNKLVSLVEEFLHKNINHDEKKFLKTQIDNFYNRKAEDMILIFSLRREFKMFEMVYNNITEHYQDSQNNANNDMYYGYNLEKIDIAIILIMYAKAFNKALILLKYYKPQFIENIEINNISNNLYKEISEYELIESKLYNIYIEFYSNIFKDELSSHDLFIISYLVNREIQVKESNIKEDIYELIKSLNIENNTNINHFEIHNFMIKLIDIDIRLVDNLQTLMDTIIDIFIDNIDFYGLINILKNKVELVKSIESYKNKIKLKQEKERYLKGDFSNEKLLNLDREKFEKIVTGEEFEIYLKDFFSKLGYEVEITKTSGDQGADLIIIKDSIKTVVQAKFYSTTVGNKAVQEVVGAIKFYGADCGMVVTNSTFTKSAIDLASANNIELVDGQILNSLRTQIYNK